MRRRKVPTEGPGVNNPRGRVIGSPWARGFGLAGVPERRAPIAGELTIESRPGAGCSIYVDVPVA